MKEILTQKVLLGFEGSTHDDQKQVINQMWAAHNTHRTPAVSMTAWRGRSSLRGAAVCKCSEKPQAKLWVWERNTRGLCWVWNKGCLEKALGGVGASYSPEGWSCPVAGSPGDTDGAGSIVQLMLSAALLSALVDIKTAFFLPMQWN